MKIVFVTDLHGCRWKYDRLSIVVQKLKANVVINGGDMLPKNRKLHSQADFITDYLDTHFAQFDEAGIYYLCYLGNDDPIIFDTLFEKICGQYSYVFCLAQRKITIGDFEFIGLNWVVDYPFRLKDRCRMDTKDYIFQKQLGTGMLSAENGWEELDDWFSYAKTLPTIEEELDQLVRPNDMAHSIYVMHMPPYKLGLDECHGGPKVGSKAVYTFLQKHQPKLSLHGHIHESPQVSGKWYAKLGRTLCIQPGQLNLFTYVSVDLHSMQFERYTDTY